MSLYLNLNNTKVHYCPDDTLKPFPFSVRTTVTPLPHGVAEEEGVLVVVAARQLGPVDAAIRWVVDTVGGVGHRSELWRDALARQRVKAHGHEIWPPTN